MESLSTTYIITHFEDVPDWSIEQTRRESLLMHKRNGAEVDVWIEVPHNVGDVYGEIMGRVSSGNDSKRRVREVMESRRARMLKKGQSRTLMLIDGPHF